MTVCKGCFKPDAADYCANCRKELFDGARVSCYLPFATPARNEKDYLLRSILRPSLPRMILKYNLQQHDRELELLTDGPGTHILKPIPAGNYERLNMAPANEHLTMQLAAQAFKIPVVPNALIYFENASGEPANISRRIYHGGDELKDQFDEACKTVSCYEDVAELMKRYIAAYKPQAEKLFSLVVFNYLFSSWSAANQNVSIVKTSYGDHLLSPAYDIICSSLHTGAGNEILENSLYHGDTVSPGYQRFGYHTGIEFMNFAKRIGMIEKRAQNVLNSFTKNEITVDYLVKRSFLDEESKRAYMDLYREKRDRLLVR
ncbi:MAG: HipA domain-containing protein [Bacteroidetes bacterium]|nr:HipA domain-containing protein [Bacteroidota bacterium]